MKDKNSEFRLFWRMLRKNKLAMLGLIILTLIVLTAIFANVLAPYDYTAQNLANMKKFPSMEHPFGTDEFGRDILSRIIYGTRQSLVIGVGWPSMRQSPSSRPCGCSCSRGMERGAATPRT